MTVAYKPAQLDRYVNMVGKQVELSVIGYSADERGQAVLVMGPSENMHPHVTISVAPGTEAVYSNELLKQGWEPVRPKLALDGVLTIENLDRT